MTARLTVSEARALSGLKRMKFHETLTIVRQMCNTAIRDAGVLGHEEATFTVPRGIYGRDVYNVADMCVELARQLYADGFDVTGTLDVLHISWRVPIAPARLEKVHSRSELHRGTAGSHAAVPLPPAPVTVVGDKIKPEGTTPPSHSSAFAVSPVVPPMHVPPVSGVPPRQPPDHSRDAQAPACALSDALSKHQSLFTPTSTGRADCTSDRKGHKVEFNISTNK